MANTGSTIRIRHSRDNDAPLTLTQGELAYSSKSDRLYIGKNSIGTETIVVTEIGGGHRSVLNVGDIIIGGDLSKSTISTINNTSLILAPMTNNIGIAGEVTITSTETVGGSTLTLNNDETITRGAISVGGIADITGNLSVGGIADITGNLLVGGNTTITGNLLVKGTTTTVESTVLTVADPIITLGESDTTATDIFSRGVEFKYGNGTHVLTGFMGLNSESPREFTFASGGAETNVNVPGTLTAGLIDGGSF